jgi:hypothetical protein
MNPRVRPPLLRWIVLGMLALLSASLPPLARAAGTAAEAHCVGLGGQLTIGVAMLTLTSVVHAAVTVIQAEVSHSPRLEAWCAPHSRRRLLLIVAVALLTGFALLLEIVMWGLLYRGLGLFTNLESSVYFSGITFTTVGYGDMTLPDCWRLLSVSEAVNGVLMAGWSTAQLVYAVQKLMIMRLQQEGRWIEQTGKSETKRPSCGDDVAPATTDQA